MSAWREYRLTNLIEAGAERREHAGGERLALFYEAKQQMLGAGLGSREKPTHLVRIKYPHRLLGRPIITRPLQPVSRVRTQIARLNGVLQHLGLPMPKVDLQSIRNAPLVARRPVSPTVPPGKPAALEPPRNPVTAGKVA